MTFPSCWPDTICDTVCRRVQSTGPYLLDNKYRDASVNIRRNQKTIDAFNRLPDEFTTEDVMRCFDLGSYSSARMRISRLVKDHVAEKLPEYVENGTTKGLFKKTGVVMLS